MAVNGPAAYGMYRNDITLRSVVQTLNQSGFRKEDICMMVSPNHPIATIMREAKTLNTEREPSALTAELMGWLMKFGAVMIPTVGLFIRSQEYLRTLMFKKDSPALSGNPKALVGLGFSEGDAERFGNQLREMGVLVYVACPGNAGMTRAVEVLRRTGAHEAATLETEMARQAAA
jgi:hypothetical protein